MAINFPSNPIADQIWTDPANNITYQFQIDPQSPPGQTLGKWTTNIRRTEGGLDEQYLRIDASNGPVTGNLQIEGYVEVNSGTSDAFTTPQTRGNYGNALISNGTGTTDWRPVGCNPGPTAPSTPFIGELWYKTTDTTLYIWYDSGSGPQWVAIT